MKRLVLLLGLTAYLVAQQPVAVTNTPPITVAVAPGIPLATQLVGPPFAAPARVTGGALAVTALTPLPTYDPCGGVRKANVAISATANTRLLQGQAGFNYRICSIVLVSSSVESFSIVEGTGATCGTNTAAVVGSTTAANGPSLAANGGYAQGNGAGTIAQSNIPGNDVCILISGSTLVAGNAIFSW